MTDRQENKMSMYHVVQDVCNKSKSVWSEMPAFEEAFGFFNECIKQIMETRLIQEGKTTGIAENKKNVEEKMIDLTISIGSAIFAYASVVGDIELKEKTYYTPSELQLSRDTILRDRCQLIHEETNKHIDSMGDYGVSTGDLEEFQMVIDNFTTLIAKPRNAIGTRVTATAKLVELFKQGDEILYNRMDKLAEKYRSSNKDFYLSYKNARIIVDMGVRHGGRVES
jgi:hypothetical protein